MTPPRATPPRGAPIAEVAHVASDQLETGALGSRPGSGSASGSRPPMAEAVDARAKAAAEAEAGGPAHPAAAGVARVTRPGKGAAKGRRGRGSSKGGQRRKVAVTPTLLPGSDAEVAPLPGSDAEVAPLPGSDAEVDETHSGAGAETTAEPRDAQGGAEPEEPCDEKPGNTEGGAHTTCSARGGAEAAPGGVDPGPRRAAGVSASKGVVGRRPRGSMSGRRLAAAVARSKCWPAGGTRGGGEGAPAGAAAGQGPGSNSKDSKPTAAGTGYLPMASGAAGPLAGVLQQGGTAGGIPGGTGGGSEDEDEDDLPLALLAAPAKRLKVAPPCHGGFAGGGGCSKGCHLAPV